MKIAPQPGPQTAFLSTEADIAFYGGGAGGGKTFGLLLEPLRNLHTPGFNGVIFRRTRPEIINPGGLWDESQIYRSVGMSPREGAILDWYIANGMSIKFAHMQYEKDKYNWQGGQIAYCGFDEVTHFTRTQFFYILSRLRSTTGVSGYVRATCNPDAESWVASFIEWWIDQDEKSPNYGLPIPERDGVLRYFIRQGDDIIWADSKEDLIDLYGPDGHDALSVTFIRSTVYDNKILLAKDPKYLSKLKSLDRVERGRLLDGNWKIKATAGTVFKRSDFKIIDTPPNVIKRIRYWDRAATEVSPKSPNPDWTAGVDMGVTKDGQYVIFDVQRDRLSPLKVEAMIKNTASQQPKVTIGLEQDPGQAGKAEAEYLARKLAGYSVKVFPVHQDKLTRAGPYSSQVEAHNFFLVRGKWNEAFLKEHENFPPDTKKKSRKKDGTDDEESSGKDDQVDASSGAFNFLTGDKVGRWVAPSVNEGSTTIAAGFTRGVPEW